jgi:hypothetical protein
MLLDWEHESERYDGSTKAAGWLSALEARPSGIWGRVEYTPDGERDVTHKSYRYLSPVLELDSETREVLSIVSVALTNRPALTMSSIGDTSAFRERVRIACSERSETSSYGMLTSTERLELKAKGWADAEIDKVAAHRARLYPPAPARGFQAMTSAEIAQRLRDGWSQTQIDSVEATRRRMYGEPARSDDATVRAECLRRGMTAEDYERATALMAQRGRAPQQ